MLELFKTCIGSHMWKMNHDYSDKDVAIIYIADTRDILLGKKIKGKQKYIEESDMDITYYEIGHVIRYLIKGNVNFIWAVMSPIIFNEYKSTLRQLREIVATQISKNIFHSINGLAQHNIYHFIQDKEKDGIYYKKLNVIARTLKFGINALIWGKYMFEKTSITTEDELYKLKEQLNNAYNTSTLPEKPNREMYERYLIKWRLFKMKLEELI